jgi:hypothetical protein
MRTTRTTLTRTIAAAIATLALLVHTAGAHAAVPAPPALGQFTSDQVAAAEQAAQQTWPGNPCTNRIQIIAVPFDGKTIGWVDWVNQAVAGNCTMHASVDYRYGGLDEVCTLIAHELGHMLGLVHVADPDDVMYTYGLKPTPPCAQAFPRPAQAAPVVAPADATVPSVDVDDSTDAPTPRPKRKTRPARPTSAQRRAARQARQEFGFENGRNRG